MAGVRVTDQCCLCLDELLDPSPSGELDLSAYPCGHVLHTKCTQELWNHRDHKCPQCKQDSTIWSREKKTSSSLMGGIGSGIVKIYLSGVAEPAPIDVDELDLDTADAERLRREVTKVREQVLARDAKLAALQEQKQLVQEEKTQVELKCQAHVQEMQGVRTENTSLKVMNNSLKVEIERAKTLAAHKETQFQSLNTSHKILENEARRLRSNESVGNAIKALDSGADPADVMRHLSTVDDKEKADQLAKMLTHRQQEYIQLDKRARDQSHDLARYKEVASKATERNQQVRKENVDLKEAVKREAARREEAEKILKGTIEQLRKDLDAERASRAQRESTLPAQSSTTPPTAQRQEHREVTIELDEDEDEDEDDQLSQTLDLEPSPHPSHAHASSHSHPSTTSSSPASASPGANRSSFASRAGMAPLNRRSLLAGPQKVILSNDPDNGGTYVRTGPDGMGGTVTVAGAKKGVVTSGGVGQKRAGAGSDGATVKKGKKSWSAASKKPYGNIGAYFQHG